MPTLLFDMMDTLIEDPFLPAVHRLMNRDQQERWHRARDPAAFLRFEAGLCSESEYFRSFFANGTIPPDLPGPAKLKKTMMREIRWLPGIPALLTRLRNRPDTRLALASNYSSWYQDVFRVRKDLKAFFDLFFFSCEIGHRKPSCEYYSAVQAALRTVRMTEIWFFDDREENLEIPRSLGWHTVRVRDAAGASSTIEEALKKSGYL